MSALACVWCACLAAAPENDMQNRPSVSPRAEGPTAKTAPEAWNAVVRDVPDLPRVLLLGDSISIGYTPFVRAALRGRANVHRPPVNCQATTRGLAGIKEWLGAGPWDVIHFNFGLHDLKYVDAKGQNLEKARGGVQQVPLAAYEQNLSALADTVLRTGAACIWCATTPVPEGAEYRVAGSELAYNAAAAKIMQGKGIAINDLHAAASARLATIQQPRNVHFTKEGSRVLAQEVVAHIVRALARRPYTARTHIAVRGEQWYINDALTYSGAAASGLLMNVRMVNAVFEDAAQPEFDAEANTNAFLAKIPEYAAHGVRAFTLCLQGGMPGYEGAVNSAFAPDGTLRDPYLARVRRVIEACDRAGLAVILGCFYQRQDQILRDEASVRAAVVNAAAWIRDCGFANVVLEIANEFGHDGFDHALIKSPEGEVELIRLAKKAAPSLLVGTSGLGDGRLPAAVCEASDVLLIHFNGTSLQEIPGRIDALKNYGKPIVCNEDDKTAADGAAAARVCVAHRASWGCMLKEVNQFRPFRFQGAADDPAVYAALEELTMPRR